MHAELQLHVPNVWQHVREVRRRVADALQGFPEELRAAAEMAAAELVENGLKYGESVPACPEVRLSVQATDEAVTLEVSNGVRSGGALTELLERLSALRTPQDAERLYMERLQRLMADPNAGGKLGLYRIGFEGRFDLSSAREGDVLTITATRRMESRQV